MAALVNQISINSSEQGLRLLSKLMTSNEEKLIKRMSMIGASYSLWRIVESKLYYSSLMALDSQNSWKSIEMGRILQNLFVSIQSRVHEF